MNQDKFNNISSHNHAPNIVSMDLGSVEKSVIAEVFQNMNGDKVFGSMTEAVANTSLTMEKLKEAMGKLPPLDVVLPKKPHNFAGIPIMETPKIHKNQHNYAIQAMASDMGMGKMWYNTDNYDLQAGIGQAKHEYQQTLNNMSVNPKTVYLSGMQLGKTAMQQQMLAKSLSPEGKIAMAEKARKRAALAMEQRGVKMLELLEGFVVKHELTFCTKAQAKNTIFKGYEEHYGELLQLLEAKHHPVETIYGCAEVAAYDPTQKQAATTPQSFTISSKALMCLQLAKMMSFGTESVSQLLEGIAGDMNEVRFLWLEQDEHYPDLYSVMAMVYIWPLAEAKVIRVSEFNVHETHNYAQACSTDDKMDWVIPHVVQNEALYKKTISNYCRNYAYKKLCVEEWL